MGRRFVSKPRVVAACVLAIVAVCAGLLLSRSSSGATRIDHVLLISIDTCRADHLSCYGYPRPTTPCVDAIAAEGVRFADAISPAPMTLPAHASLLTGTIPLFHGVHDNLSYRLRPSSVTLAEVLRDHGFHTSAVVGSFVLDSKFGLAQGFGTYDDKVEPQGAPGTLPERKADEVTRLAIDWLGAHRTERSFLFVHYYDPHIPYEPPDPFRSAFADDLYAGEIAYTDHCIGQLVDRLKEWGLYDRTLIILVGDHGEMLGEHGEQTHSYFIYQAGIKVPFIVRLPGGGEPAVVEEPVGLIDIVPTVLGLLAIEPTSPVQGNDLSGGLLASGRSAFSDDRQLYCESFTPTKYDANTLLGLVTDRWKYIQTTRPELYDLAADPGETRNLAAQETDQADFMRERLRQIMSEHYEQSGPESVITLDDQDRRRLESLGYVAGEVVDAPPDFDDTKEDPKDLIEFHEMRGRLTALLLQRKPVEALALCEEMLRQRPDFGRGYVVLAKIAMEREDFSTAVSALRRALELNPEAVDLHYQLGNALASEGKLEAAIGQFQHALQLDPRHAKAHGALGRALQLTGRVEEAIGHFRQAVECRPDLPEAHNDLGNALAANGQLDEAIDCFRQALSINPDYAEAHYNLGVALASRGRLQEAIDQYREALRVKPDYVQAHGNLAVALQAKGEIGEAIFHYQQALQTAPDSVELRCALAGALTQAGRLDEALDHYRAVLRLQPRSVSSLNGAAWILATHPDPEAREPEEAIRLAARASDLTGHSNPGALDTLAAAYAAAGQFDRAVTTAEQALSLATAASEEELANRIRKRLELYRRGSPYRSPASAQVSVHP
jgi:arylsulfatase A-like enzyme/Flp pilus assembly protein TadD